MKKLINWLKAKKNMEVITEEIKEIKPQITLHERLYSVYVMRFEEENSKPEDQINWAKWEGLDKACYQLAKMENCIDLLYN